MTVTAPAVAGLDPGVLVGDWRNTNAEGSIARIVCTRNDGGSIDVRAYGRYARTPGDWGSVPASVYAFTFEERAAGAFSARFELGEARVDLQANVKLGVLVVVELITFLDGSGRSHFFDREFFHQVKG
ncbi:MAG TPA: hypothetical protein VN380_12370 [Thermoanaerobaculia bacterium]|jgi:hypothetical protein|nr:hypothetical protein [Thermoanaerobaculia bacterium]